MKYLIISISLSLLLALFGYIKKAMTNSALLLAFLFTFLITYYGGISSYLILVTVFLGTVIASKIRKNERLKININTIEKYGQKDIYEIIANVGVGTILIILYKFLQNELLLVIYASIMAESLADSLASDIGVLSHKRPINIITLKRSEPGLSGNISLLGLASSFIGSLIIGLIFTTFTFNIKYLIIITLSGFLGAIFDSVLGATIQVKYKCCACQKITEKKMHCQKKTKYYKGIKAINNDLVNLLSNIIAGIISYIFLISISL